VSSPAWLLALCISIYTLAGLAMSWLAFIPLAAFVLFYWIPGMIRKERSLARYPGFNEYREHVRFLIPFLI
jgi:protein-S-isoprenylcysteine O-methyltransferase Ste14